MLTIVKGQRVIVAKMCAAEKTLLLMEPRMLFETFHRESFGGLDGEHVSEGTFAIVWKLHRANIRLYFILHFGAVLGAVKGKLASQQMVQGRTGRPN